jgi:hypothetical protein
MTEPVMGWRLWHLRSGVLHSWAIENCWEPGENRARCLDPGGRPCDAPPGRHCHCGFWALWSPAQCVDRARGMGETASHVMGLIAGWGTVALHGREGFRAERASIACLFVDRPSGGAAPPGITRRVATWLGWPGRREPEPADHDETEPEPRRLRLLRDAARRYGVPLVSVQGAAQLGLLSEWGVPREQVLEARRLTARAG